MGKDFRLGLVAGVVLAGVALIWVATRPSLSPQAVEAQNFASLRQSMQDSAPAEQPAEDTLSPGNSRAAQTVPVADLTAATGERQRTVPAETHSVAETKNPSPVPASITGVSAPSAPPGIGDLTIHELSEPIKTTKFHIVRRGESLSAISQQYYGSSNQWRKILSANQKAVKDSNRIAPGTKLIIPD